MPAAPDPDIKHHPNQESKSGRPSYASAVRKNSSTNDPLQDSVVGGVEQKMREEIVKKKKKGDGKSNISGKHRTDTNR
jgi:hypothetical protein